MPRAGPELSPWLNLSTLRKMPSKSCDVLVVDLINLVDAKGANLSARHKSAATAASPAARSVSPVAIAAAATAAAKSGPGLPAAAAFWRLVDILFVICHV